MPFLPSWKRRLNGVRPRWPEQWTWNASPSRIGIGVSMESGLDGRNNWDNLRFADQLGESQWSPA